MVTEGLSTGKTILIGTIVLGCFAVLWPKIFAPMLFGEPELPRKHEHPIRGSSDHPEFVHPALRSEHLGRGRPGPGGLMGGGEGEGKLFYGEEGRQMRKPMEFRPGPAPGMRPSMGGPGMQPPQQQRGQGSMGILMPIYTIGIVIFFLYTVMKIMFKRDNEQEERYSQAQQPTHKLRGGINQYGQQHPYQYKNDGVHGQRDEFDAASLRIRQFQQQQERMRQMQNANSTKSPFPQTVPSQLSSIPEVYQHSSSITTTKSQMMSMKDPITASVKESTSDLGSEFNSSTIQNSRNYQNDSVNEKEDASPSLSNVMEGLINVAETVVASKHSVSPHNQGVDSSIQKDPLPNDQKTDEIEVLKKKLEETQKAMELIMAQVNKVSTEVRNPTESTFEKPIAEVSKHEKQPDNEFLVENIGSPIFLQDRDINDGKNSLQETQSNAHDTTTMATNTDPQDPRQNVDTVQDNIDVEINTKEELYDQENLDCSMDRFSEGRLRSTDTGNSEANFLKKQQIEDEIVETTFDDHSGDHNEFSESDSGIQQHYETMDFPSQNMYQDESGYSYYYEDVHYDEEDDSEGEEELEEYSHPRYQQLNSHPYASCNEYTNGQIENIHGYPSEKENTATSQDRGQEWHEQTHPVNEENPETEGLQIHVEETRKVHDNGENDNHRFDSKLEENDLRVGGRQTLEEQPEEDDNGPRQNENLEQYMDKNLKELYNEEIDNSQSSHQHRKTVELIETKNNGEGIQHENKQPKTFLGSHNSKNRRKKKLRKT